MSDTDFIRPHPALTPAQRLHLDVYGYVVIENALTESETKALLEATYAIEEDFHAQGPIRASGQVGLPWCAIGTDSTPDWDPDIRSHHYSGRTREYFRVDNLPHLGAPFLEHVTNLRLVGMAEEAIGSEARLEQSDAHIARPPEKPRPDGYGFHRGSSTTASFQVNGLYHFPFVKTLTNLTDLGLDDGGTTVIAGTHKVGDEAMSAVIEAALTDPKRPLVHQVVAPAGSTLLFFESLMHSGGTIRSGKDRVFIVAGYTPTNHQACEGYEPVPSLKDEVSEEVWAFLAGTKGWRSAFGSAPKARRLADPVDD